MNAFILLIMIYRYITIIDDKGHTAHIKTTANLLSEAVDLFKKQLTVKAVFLRGSCSIT